DRSAVTLVGQLRLPCSEALALRRFAAKALKRGGCPVRCATISPTTDAGLATRCARSVPRLRIPIAVQSLHQPLPRRPYYGTPTPTLSGRGIDLPQVLQSFLLD